MRFVCRVGLLVALVLGLASSAMGQDQPRPPQAGAKPHPPSKPEFPAKAPRKARPAGKPALPPGAASAVTPAKKPPSPACERDLRAAALRPGHLGVMVEPWKTGAWRLLDVLPGSLGAREGLLPGDVIVGLRGVPQGPSLPARFAKLRPQQRFGLRLRRDGRSLVVPIRWVADAKALRPTAYQRCIPGRLGRFEPGAPVRFELHDGMKPPAAGTEGRLWWALEKKHGGFGPGVKIGLGKYRVLESAASTFRLKMLEETIVTYKGRRLSLPEPGKPVELHFDQGRLL